MSMFRVTLLITVALLSSQGHAQDLISPGHDDINISFLETDEVDYSIVVKQGAMQQPFGSVVGTTTIDEENGLIEFIRSYDMMGQKFADTVRAHWPSLRPLYHAEHNPQRSLQFTADEGMIVGTHRPAGGEEEAFEVSVDGSVFDAAMNSVVATMLPLGNGYSATLATYDFNFEGVAEYILETSGPLEIELENGAKVQAWEVTVTDPGNESVRYYVTPDAHELVRIVMSPQPGVEVFIDAELDADK